MFDTIELRQKRAYLVMSVTSNIYARILRAISLWFAMRYRSLIVLSIYLRKTYNKFLIWQD